MESNYSFIWPCNSCGLDWVLVRPTGINNLEKDIPDLLHFREQYADLFAHEIHKDRLTWEDSNIDYTDKLSFLSAYKK